jgi:hypothetical protein
MSYYKPTQTNLRFIYSKILNNVLLKSEVTVPLNPGETLAKTRADYDGTTKTINKTFDYDPNGPQINPNNYRDDSGVEILKQVKTIYDPKHEDVFLASLRKELAKSYDALAILNAKPGGSDPGGQVTNTITSSGQIEIV